MSVWALLVVPLGLGLLGFIEPCTVGSSLLFIKYLEGKEPAAKLRETAAFTVTRAAFIGSLGAIAAAAGASVLKAQRWFWVLLGSAYVVLGILYFAKKQWMLMRVLGPNVSRGTARGRAALLGVVFGLNIPACATPLLGALVAASAGAGNLARGFVTMAMFGLALSMPLAAAVFSARARGWLDRLAGLSERLPVWTGAVFVLLGLWSISFGLKA